MKKEELRVIFMGTPEIAAKVFENMILDGYHFIALIAQEDKPVGRKKIIMNVPTKEVAIKYNIPVYQPHRIRDDYEFVKELNPDIIITMAYGQIVPQGLLDIPQYGCLNLHGSLLPKYRGAAPMQRAIINNEKETGVTLMEMIDKMDAGRMYGKLSFSIENNTYSEVYEKMGDAASRLVINLLPKYIDGELKGEVQNEDEVSFANKILPEDEKLNLTTAQEFISWVKALSEEPGGYVYLDDKKLKILDAQLFDNNVSSDKYPLGYIDIINKKLTIQLIDGRVEILSLKPEGGKIMKPYDFYNGHKNIISNIVK